MQAVHVRPPKARKSKGVGGTVVFVKGNKPKDGSVLFRALGRRSTYIDVFKADPTSHIEELRIGVKPTQLVEIAKSMGSSTAEVLKMLRVAKSTFNRKLSKDLPLTMDEGERVLGFLKIVGQVENMVATSGDPTGFDALQWVASWIERPIPALGNRCPKEFLDTSEGQKLVSDTLAKIGSGAYA